MIIRFIITACRGKTKQNFTSLRKLEMLYNIQLRRAVFGLGLVLSRIGYTLNNSEHTVVSHGWILYYGFLEFVLSWLLRVGL